VTTGDKWGKPVSEEQQGEHAEVLAAWEVQDADRSKRKGPFEHTRLIAAEVSRLAGRSRRNEFGFIPNLRLEEGRPLWGVGGGKGMPAEDVARIRLWAPASLASCRLPTCTSPARHAQPACV